MTHTHITPTSTLDYARELNTQQLAVVRNGDGPCLVLAGAGSGKTRVLIYRLAYLLEQGVDPRSILLATFTNKAAREMITRSEAILRQPLKGLWAGTFHHIGNMLLRRETAYTGYADNFTIVDKEDALSLIADCVEDLGYTKKDTFFPKKDLISTVISMAANTQRSLEQVVYTHYPHITDFSLPLSEIAVQYRKKKINANIMDFDDLLTGWLALLRNEALLQKYSSQFRYILVDEYQDTNKLQFEILKRMAGHHKNILAVGDDAQSIYSFRGAEIRNILEFGASFPGAKIFKLEINYRSTKPILKLANAIIKNNTGQFHKELTATRGSGALPALVQTKDTYQQAQFVVQKTIEAQRQGTPLSDIAILVRSHFQAMEVEMELLKRGIPYIVRGGVRFFEQSHIKDIMAYLKLTINPRDEISFKRALALHKGIGRSYACRIWDSLRGGKHPADIGGQLPKKQQEGFREFIRTAGSASHKKPQEAIQSLLALYKEYCFLHFDNPEDRLMDIEELAGMSREYPTLERFIAELNTYENFKKETPGENNTKNDMLIVSTIHQAKGLEWNTVFLIGLANNEFPHQKCTATTAGLEEERRLFYVAVTRAKEQLFMTYPHAKYTSKNGLLLMTPSLFISELNDTCFENWHVEE